jgi:fluoroquinolone transport system permease protein
VTGAVGAAGRVRALLGLEARVQWRYGVMALAAGLGAAWTGLLLALPAPAARAVAPWLLMLETAVLFTTLAGALVILERGQGMRAALAVTPARAAEPLAAKLGLLTGLVLAVAVPVALAGHPTSVAALPLVLLGVGLTALLTMLLAVAVAARCQSVLTFMIGLPLVLLPLLLPALAHAAGWRHPLLYAAPTTGAMDLVRAGYGDPPAGLGWSAGWLLLATAVAAWAALRPAKARWAGVVRWDPMLLLIVVSPVLLALAARFGYPPLRDWLARVHELDLDPYRPVLLGLVVVLHVPVAFGMAAALRVLDDVDDRVLMAIRVSPLTLPRYLRRRAGLVTVGALVGLVVAAPLSGLLPPAGWPAALPAVLLASLLAPLTMLAALAVAGNKVEGVAVLKLLGLPLYAPVAGWWLTGPAGWPFAVLPSWWMLRSLWTGSPALAAAGLAVTAALLVPLARRTLTTLRRS